MFKRLASLLCGIALLTNTAAVDAQTDAATAEAVMRSSGLWAQLAPVAPQIRAGFLAQIAQSGSDPGAAEVERLSKLIDAAYAVDRLRSAASRSIETDMRAEHIPPLRRWYDSTLGMAITALEVAATAKQTDPGAVVQQGNALLASMPAVRRAMLEDFVAATRSAETLTDMTVEIALAAHRSAVGARPGAPSVAPVDLRSALDAQRPKFMQAFTALALAGSAAAYAALPTAELGDYIGFLKSDAGRHFTDVASRALRAALVLGSSELARGLPRTRNAPNT